MQKQISILFFRRRASPGQYMIFVTILSVSLNARKFFEFTHNMDGSDYETTSLMEYKPYIVFSNTWQELVVTGALPFIVLVISNINIYLKIRESSKHESHRYAFQWVNYLRQWWVELDDELSWLFTNRLSTTRLREGFDYFMQII